MNDRIHKYRIWDKSYGYYIKDSSNCIAEMTMLNIAHYLCRNKISNIDNLIFQQFTGLLDKNGKEIYEGDIIKSSNQKWEVVYFCGAYYLKNKKDSAQLSHFEYDAEYCDTFRLKELKIIGNIFENPDLLKH